MPLWCTRDVWLIMVGVQNVYQSIYLNKRNKKDVKDVYHPSTNIRQRMFAWATDDIQVYFVYLFFLYEENNSHGMCIKTQNVQLTFTVNINHIISRQFKLCMLLIRWYQLNFWWIIVSDDKKQAEYQIANDKWLTGLMKDHT